MDILENIVEYKKNVIASAKKKYINLQYESSSKFKKFCRSDIIEA